MFTAGDTKKKKKPGVLNGAPDFKVLLGLYARYIQETTHLVGADAENAALTCMTRTLQEIRDQEPDPGCYRAWERG